MTDDVTQARAIWNDLEEARVINYEGDTLNKEKLINILAAALRAERKKVWELVLRRIDELDHDVIYRDGGWEYVFEEWCRQQAEKGRH